MKTVHVIATNVITALGDLDATWQSLLAGKSGLAMAPPALSISSPVGGISAADGDYGSSRRLQNILEMILPESPLPENTRIIFSTTKAAVDELLAPETAGGQWPGQPWNLANLLPAAMQPVSPPVTISAACASGTLAIIHGAQRILSGEMEFALIIGIDLLSRFVGIGFDKLKAATPDHCRPFDRNRNGLALGEGAGLMLLGEGKALKERGYHSLATISGWGASCDATHITAPSREAVGLIAAINQATGNRSMKIGAINAHGTGTSFNDAMEIRGFSELWPTIPPFHSVKGAIGHCLGAAGVIEGCIAVKSLREEMIPPTVGILEPEPQIASAIVMDGPAPLPHPSILACNSGFGGINGAIVFGV